jgi:hypothetical protein
MAAGNAVTIICPRPPGNDPECELFGLRQNRPILLLSKRQKIKPPRYRNRAAAECDPSVGENQPIRFLGTNATRVASQKVAGSTIGVIGVGHLSTRGAVVKRGLSARIARAAGRIAARSAAAATARAAAATTAVATAAAAIAAATATGPVAIAAPWAAPPTFQATTAARSGQGRHGQQRVHHRFHGSSFLLICVRSWA